ncbi:MAG: hypothetical protein E7270_10640 [Lachnospiraceae bacterium]|nr:hypothetical protein [Lachnospiraceae bacterium]MBQ4069308.1 hypothetical protein [Lachnospiraceae bacterium]
MGLLSNMSSVMRKNEQVTIAGEDKKILLNINSRIEDLKLQNMENAKFLRGLSRKIETELEQIKEAEINRSIEVHDESLVISGIERVEKALEEINNNDVMEEIDRINKAIIDINNNDVIEEIGRINKTLEDSVVKIDSSMSKLDTEKVMNIVAVVNELQDKVDKVSADLAEVTNKVNGVLTLPSNIKTTMNEQGSEISNKVEEISNHLRYELNAAISSNKKMTAFNLWLSFLNVALLIAFILGIFN